MNKSKWKFSLLQFLIAVFICASLTTIVVLRQTLYIKSSRLDEIESVVADYRERLGEFEITDPSKHQIRHFDDEFSSSSSKEFRWRIYIPKGSRCRVCYITGSLPNEGLPEEHHVLGIGPIKGPTSCVLVVENRELYGTKMDDFGIALYSNENGPAKLLTGMGSLSVDWVPWFNHASGKFTNPPLDKTTTFTLDDPFVIMNHYLYENDKSKKGYLVWLEEIE